VAAHAAHAPAFAAFRRPRDLGHNAIDLLRRYRRFATAPGSFFKAGEPTHLETVGPHRNTLRRRIQSDRYFSDAHTLEPEKNNLGPLALAHPARPCPRPPPQLLHDLWFSP
jgi:hypothetical protein